MQTETPHNVYVSRDQLVSISIINPQHWPPHDYKCAAVLVVPKPHERVRQLGDKTIEIVFTKEEIRALVEAMAECDPDFGVTFTHAMRNKPEIRKEKWRKINQKRISQRRFYRNYRSGRRH
jgi:hypothetical protein